MFRFSDKRCRKFKKALRNKEGFLGSLYLSNRDMADVGLSQDDYNWCLANHADEILDEAYRVIRKKESQKEFGGVYSSSFLMFDYLKYGSQPAQSRFFTTFWSDVSKWLTLEDSFIGITHVFGQRLVTYFDSPGDYALFQPTHELLMVLRGCLSRWDSFELPLDALDDDHRKTFSPDDRDRSKYLANKAYELLEPHAK